jgi:hypothetical protein
LKINSSYEFYSDSSCSKSNGLAKEYFLSFCEVQTLVASNNATYYSTQWRHSQDLSRSTIVFFKNSNCDGTPDIQANTVPDENTDSQPGYFPPLGECLGEVESSSGRTAYRIITLGNNPVGNPFDTYAVKVVEFRQTDTCDSAGLVSNLYFRSGTCLNFTSTEDESSSFVISEGSINNIGIEIYPCANCDCEFDITNISVVEEDTCEIDDYDYYYYYDAFIDDAQLESYAGYVEEESHYITYALPQTCLWSTGCSNSPGGKTCEVGTYCKEYQWWSQCLENTVDNSKPQIANPSKKCISTRNGHGPNAHWGCSFNADCCNPQAVCNAFSRTCNLPCEAMDEPESLSISNDAALSGSSLVVFVPVVVGVGLFAILASLSLYYFICRRSGASTKSQDFESQCEMTVVVNSETEVHVFE